MFDLGLAEMNKIFPDKSSQGKWEKLMPKITQLFQRESISPEIQVVLEMLKEDITPGNQATIYIP